MKRPESHSRVPLASQTDVGSACRTEGGAFLFRITKESRYVFDSNGSVSLAVTGEIAFAFSSSAGVRCFSSAGFSTQFQADHCRPFFYTVVFFADRDLYGERERHTDGRNRERNPWSLSPSLFFFWDSLSPHSGMETHQRSEILRNERFFDRRIKSPGRLPIAKISQDRFYGKRRQLSPLHTSKQPPHTLRTCVPHVCLFFRWMGEEQSRLSFLFVRVG